MSPIPKPKEREKRTKFMSRCLRNKDMKNKFKRIGKKIIIPLLWFTMALLLLSIIIITQEILIKPLNKKSFLVLPFIFFIVYFIWILFMSITKYKKETLLNDIERKAKWKYLSQEYKRFYKHMHILGISLSIFMFISGVWLLAIKDPYGWLLLILGINILVTNIILLRRKNELDN